MLVLSRKKGERIVIGDSIEITVISVQGDRVRLGFDAPRDISIHRSEIQERIVRQQDAASPAPVPSFESDERSPYVRDYIF